MIFLLGKLYRFFVNKYFNNFFIRVSKEKFPKVLYSFFYLFFVFSPIIIFYVFAIIFLYLFPIAFPDFVDTLIKFISPIIAIYLFEIMMWVFLYFHVLIDIIISKEKEKITLYYISFISPFASIVTKPSAHFSDRVALPHYNLKVDKDHIITKKIEFYGSFLIDIFYLFSKTVPYIFSAVLLYLIITEYIWVLFVLAFIYFISEWGERDSTSTAISTLMGLFLFGIDNVGKK